MSTTRAAAYRRRPALRYSFVPLVEALEQRTVLSVTQAGNGDVIVTGGAQADSVLVAADTPTTVRVTLNGVDFGPFTLAANNKVTVDSLGGNDTVTVTAQGRSVIVNGGTGTNTLAGPSASNTWGLTGSNAGTLNGLVSFSNVGNLRGGSSNDLFQFATAASVAGTIDGGGGTNTLDYSASSGDVIVNLGTRAASAVNTTHDAGFVGIQSFIGGAGVNRLFGTNATTTWNLNGSDAGSLSSGFSFSGFGILGGGSGNDTFVFTGGASVSRIVNGGGGSNTLDYSGLSTAVNVNLARAAVTAVNQTQSGSIVSVQNFIGGSGQNRFFGRDASTTWNLSGNDAATLTGGFSFAGFGTLGGGAGNDTFAFGNGATISGCLNGGAGTNTLDYTAYTTDVVVSLPSKAATGIRRTEHNSMLSIQAFIGNPAFLRRAGGSVHNTLLGPNSSNTWNITGFYVGNIDGNFHFTDFDVLKGGTLDDTFRYVSGAAEIIDGGSGQNWLDYSALDGIEVNLATGTATGIGTMLRNVQHVIGGRDAGNTITGDDFAAGGNILVGGPVGDRIVAGAGRSLLIGGGGENQFHARGNGDILIGGSTNYETPVVNKAALLAILAEWQRTDIDYQTRVNHLRNGTGLSNGNSLTLGVTVFHTSFQNIFNGGGDLDWFFADEGDDGDRINNFQTGEQIN